MEYKHRIDHMMYNLWIISISARSQFSIRQFGWWGWGSDPSSPVYSSKDNEISDPLTLFCTRSSSKAEIVSMIESSQEKERSQQQHKAEMAFKLMDRNNDGYVTKQEMLSTTKKLTQKQVRCDE